MKTINKLCLLITSILILTGCSIKACQMEYQPFYTSSQFQLEKQKVLIIYNDPYGSLEVLTEMIKTKTSADIYNIQDKKLPNINIYDIILIGDTPINNQPTCQMINFLNNYQLDNKKVSTYWIGAMDNVTYETEIKKHIQNKNIISGLGFNSDEISEKELISYFVNEWVSSLYYLM